LSDKAVNYQYQNNRIMQNKPVRHISVTFHQTIGAIIQKPFQASYSHLVIHTPHAGRYLPVASDGNYYATGYKMNRIRNFAYLLTDYYTDKLFSTNLPSATQISFDYSRVFCDVERLLNDPLEEKGLGICYNLKRFVALDIEKPVWNKSKEETMNLYYEHHRALANSIQENTLLLDCHSFSEHDNVLCPNAHEYKDIDICLGYNEDQTKPSEEVLQFVANFFMQKGYRVVFNKPFSNSKTAETEHQYHSLMIEVNKHCYMNEETLEKTNGFEKFHNELQNLYKLLLK
jgi:N-formylglutamate amidohydrolase